MRAILCFGDSITQGRGENPSIGWVGRLKEKFENEDFFNAIYNLGIPGETSINLLNRFEIEVQSRVKYIRKGDEFMIIIAVGINDLKSLQSSNNSQIPLIEYRKNVQTLITIAQQYTPYVVIVSINPVNEALTSPFEGTYISNKIISQYNNILSQLCVKYSCKYVDIFEQLLAQHYIETLKDGIHPNSQGYKLLFDLILAQLKKTNFI